NLLNNSFFFFNHTTTSAIYTLSLHDALPISIFTSRKNCTPCVTCCLLQPPKKAILLLQDACNKESNEAMTDETKRTKTNAIEIRSEEHTSELQSQSNLVCRLLLEKKNAHRSN